MLFADADTNYVSRDLIQKAVSYMQKENLDVLTGIPSSEKLNRFWSKIIMPSWDFIDILFKVGSADLNDSKSKVAYLMGAFFLIERETFVKIGLQSREDHQHFEDIPVVLQGYETLQPLFGDYFLT